MTPEPTGDPTPAPPPAPSAPPSPASALATPAQPPGPVGWAGLPSDALAHSFAFLPFSDLRSAVLTGKHAALDAAKRVDTLNITETSELNLRAVQRYRQNAEVVSIGCLFTGEVGEDERLRNYVSEKACWRIVPFLVGFPKLREAIFYGITFDRDGTPRNDKMKILLNCFCANFETGALPSDLSITGLLLGPGYAHLCPPGDGCEMCRAHCKIFPFCVLESSFYSQAVVAFRPSLSHDGFLRIVSQRRGWDKYVSENPTRLLERAIAQGENTDQDLGTYFGISSSEVDSFLRGIERKYYPSHEEFEENDFHYHWVYSINPYHQAAIDGLISHGFSPEKISAEILKDCLLAYPAPRGPKLIGEDSYQWLVSRGFNLDEEKFIPVRRNDVEKLEAIISE